MFTQLDAALDNLTVPLTYDALRGVFVRRDRLDAIASGAFGDYCAAGFHQSDGATSAANWLMHETGMSGRQARVNALAVTRCRELPHLRDAWQAGRVSSGQVGIVMAHVTAASLAAFAEAEAALIPTLEALDGHDTERVMTHFAHCARADGTQPKERPGTLHHNELSDGTWTATAHYDAYGGLVIHDALAVAKAVDRRVGDEHDLRTAAQAAHDASVAVHQFYLDHHDLRLPRRNVPHVTLVLTADQMMASRPTADAGTHVPPTSTTVEQILCDCEITRAVMDARGQIIDYGRSTRVISKGLRRAITARDCHCRYPGCDRPASWCEVHHAILWTNDGPTCPSNLVLLCSRHHHQLHQPGWTATLDPDATLHVTRPTGHHQTTRPPGTLSNTT